jgi:hypothetical protein
MAKDDRDILDVLKFELSFLENGGYGRSVRTPWKGTSIFQDSITCINFGDPERSRPCDECLLIDFVPIDQQSSNVPCHHIPITDRGETIEFIEQGKSREEVVEAVRDWLRKIIHQIEVERIRPTTH